MLISGILNPAINSLLSRVRHTNTLVIADRGFPFWPQIETVDISLVDDIPTVLDVLAAIQRNFVLGSVFMASEFRSSNDAPTQARFQQALAGTALIFEPHIDFKKRVGLVRQRIIFRLACRYDETKTDEQNDSSKTCFHAGIL